MLFPPGACRKRRAISASGGSGKMLSSSFRRWASATPATRSLSCRQRGSIPRLVTGRKSPRSGFVPATFCASWTFNCIRPWYWMAVPLTSTMSSRSNRFPISSARSHTRPSNCPVRSRRVRFKYGFPALLTSCALFPTRNRSRTCSPSLISLMNFALPIDAPSLCGEFLEDAEGTPDPVHGRGDDSAGVTRPLPHRIQPFQGDRFIILPLHPDGRGGPGFHGVERPLLGEEPAHRFSERLQAEPHVLFHLPREDPGKVCPDHAGSKRPPPGQVEIPPLEESHQVHRGDPESPSPLPERVRLDPLLEVDAGEDIAHAEILHGYRGHDAAVGKPGRPSVRAHPVHGNLSRPGRRGQH